MLLTGEVWVMKEGYKGRLGITIKMSQILDSYAHQGKPETFLIVLVSWIDLWLPHMKQKLLSNPTSSASTKGAFGNKAYATKCMI